MTVSTPHHKYLNRCYELAQLSGLEIGTNPKVGAVLVFRNKIIGEGRYEKFGSSHAEINAINSVNNDDKKYIKDSILYVSLEPCCITGKTPPCTSAIIREKIKDVHVGAIDPFPGIAGNGIKYLEAAGVNVTVHNDHKATQLIVPFTTYHIKKRPFVTLKFAKSNDNYIGRKDKQIWLTNSLTNIYTHKLRSQSQAILIGTNTAVLDNPSLTTRNFPGHSPHRLVIDKKGVIPASHHILADGKKATIFNHSKREELDAQIEQITIKEDTHMLSTIMDYCYQNQLVYLMVEGGSKLIKSFVEAEIWDKAIIIETDMIMNQGIKAPMIHGRLQDQFSILTDIINVVRPN